MPITYGDEAPTPLGISCTTSGVRVRRDQIKLQSTVFISRPYAAALPEEFQLRKLSLSPWSPPALASI